MTVALSTHSHLQLEPGDMIDGRYRIVRRVADGGMGTVYLVEHALIHRRLALKVLHDELAHDDNIVRQFMAEATAAGTLGHPNIVESTDMGFTKDGVPFIVFEYLEGPLLVEEVHRVKGMPVRRALRIAQQIASALAAAHRADIVHLDLKSENVILTDKDGAADHVKVLDFGISRFMSPDPARTHRHVVAGTPEYMAPEQVTSPDDVDRRADVYALGVVIYEMLTARRPFEGSDPRTLLWRVVHEAVPPMQRRNMVPAALERFVIEGLLAKDRAARVQTMDDVLDQLKALGATHRQGPSTFVAPVPPPIAARTTQAQPPLPKPASMVAPDPEALAAAIDRSLAHADEDLQLAPRPPRAPTEVIELATRARPRLCNADLEVDIEVVRPVSLPPPPAAPRASATRWLALGAVIAAGLGGAARLGPESRRTIDPGAQQAVTRDAAKLAALLAVDARAATARAQTIAASPAVRAAVATDAATVADRYRRGALALAPEPGEVIELVQQAGDGTLPLLRLPASAHAVAPGNDALVAQAPQVVANARGDGLELVVNARVARADGGVGGAVRLAVPFQPELAQRLVAADGERVELAGFAAPIALTGADVPAAQLADALEVRAPLPLGADVAVAQPLALVAHVVPADANASWRVAGNVGLAGGGLGGFALAFGSLRARRRRTAAHAAQYV